MNKSQFISTLKNSSMVNANSVDGLEDLVNRYPYFQSAQLLLTKAYHSSENLSFETSLKQTAAYAANRTQLHALLFSKNEDLTHENTEARVEPKEVVIDKNESINAIASVNSNYTDPDPLEKPAIGLSPIETKNTPEITASAIKGELMTEITTPVDQSVILDKEILLEKATIESTINNPEEITVEQTMITPIKNETTSIEPNITEVKPDTEDEKKNVLEQDKFSIDFSKVEDNSANEHALQNQILSAAVSSSILLEVSDEIPDIDSLNSGYIKNETSINFEEETGEKPKPVKENNGSHSFTDWLKQIEAPVEEEKAEKNESVTLFFENKREKVGFYSPVKMARLSVQENNDLVTETLANIYADQEHFEKAISAFEKLQLKYPEKSVYFAGRIKEIQNQLNT